MAVPKKKTSKSKTRSRRAANMKLHLPQLSVCPDCGAAKMPHRVCPSCGFYKGKEIIEVGFQK